MFQQMYTCLPHGLPCQRIGFSAFVIAHHGIRATGCLHGLQGLEKLCHISSVPPPIVSAQQQHVRIQRTEGPAHTRQPTGGKPALEMKVGGKGYPETVEGVGQLGTVKSYRFTRPTPLYLEKDAVAQEESRKLISSKPPASKFSRFIILNYI